MINKKTKQIKLIDLGSATPIPLVDEDDEYNESRFINLFYGTKKFAAPEAILGEPYLAEMQEAWSIGCLLYVMLYKMDPFRDDEEILNVDILTRMSKSDVIVSDLTKHCIAKMMSKDWRCRLRLEQIGKLPIFRSPRAVLERN
jgi:serine/threonine protein kinase